MEPLGWGKKRFKRYHQLLSLAPTITSITSIPNDMGDDMILRAVYRYPGIYLTTEENPGKLQL